jgi:hypothetical protein
LPPDYNPKGDCMESYEGVLCSVCEVGYSKSKPFVCAKCPDRTKNIVRLMFILIVICAAVVYLVMSTLKGANDERNVTSIFLKILMNHL